MQYGVLWADKWNYLDLAIEYYADPLSFKSELMNDADRIGEKAFHQVKAISHKEMEYQEFTQTILCVDPAVEIAKHNDYSAFLVGSKTSNNFKYVRKGIVEKLKFDDYIDKVIYLLKEYDDISVLWIEKNTYNGADVREIEKRIQSDTMLKNRKINILNERQNKNKENKIRAIGGKVDSGFIVFNEDDTDFIGQILDYQGEGYSRFDDAPDVLAEFDRLIDTIEYKRKPISFLDRRSLGL